MTRSMGAFDFFENHPAIRVTRLGQLYLGDVKLHDSSGSHCAYIENVYDGRLLPLHGELEMLAPQLFKVGVCDGEEFAVKQKGFLTYVYICRKQLPTCKGGVDLLRSKFLFTRYPPDKLLQRLLLRFRVNQEAEPCRIEGCKR